MSVEVEQTSTLPPPGSFFSLGDPGLFEVRITLGAQQRSIVTSVDAVSDQNNPTLGKTHQLFAALRGVGPLICDAQTFFGIARAEIGSR
jgi:hypothetical protein